MQFSLKSIFLVTTCLGAALGLFSLAPEQTTIVLVAIVILFGIAALMSKLLGADAAATRVVMNALIGMIAGGIPGLVYFATMPLDGQAAMGAQIVTALGTTLGFIAGAIGGALGIGVRAFSFVSVARTLVAASAGSMLARTVTPFYEVIVMPLLIFIGITTAMWLSTDRKSPN